ncbi:MAG TPA: hypothetical protein VEV84_14090 [Pyrinomonadaceae bacterium]|nr:hypothetical protein [Pyrinomonadaceae bacterium]
MSSVKPEEFQTNVRQNKQVLKDLAALITEEINRRSTPPAGWDFRFMLIVAQWLIEQGRYTMTPEGNNPGNVVGAGDAGSFTRPYNTEFVDGKRVPRPDVPFARYSSMQLATKIKFDALQSNWPGAHQAVMTGGSADEYANGLYPGFPKNYATAPRGDYASGMRIRLKQLIPHYILTCEDDIKEIDQMAGGISGTPPPSGTSLDYRNDLTLNKNMRSVLENLRDELKKLEQRVKANGRVQP